jgi:hypothetical protein
MRVMGLANDHAEGCVIQERVAQLHDAFTIAR